MTTETASTEPYDFSADPHGFTKEDVLGEDYTFDVILRSIVGEANDSDNSMTLTVSIDGQVISGVAISSKAWRERLSAFVGETNPESGQGINTFLTELFADLEETRKEREEKNLPSAALRYIHMRDAYVVTGGSSQHFPLWRGNLTKLSGWSLGSINSPEEASGN